ncbi:ROK family protein [Mariprofundus ferrooxydans]|nr:ROK family protein [Mariprofundus ferrooxydans]
MKIGIDLGGSKIELIALDSHGIEHLRVRRPTPAGDYHATLALIAAMVRQAESQLGVLASVGIGTPGALSLATGRMKNCNSTCLNGELLQQDIEALLLREVRLSNDANCFALSEAIDGAAQGYPVVFAVILGTGVGGGLVVHGRVLDGANHIAGEWGHNPLPVLSADDLPQPACYCGKSGCIETWLSGPAMRADHYRHTNDQLSAEAIAAAAKSGDDACRQTLQRYTARLAAALAAVINIVDPDVIVLGGGLSNMQFLYKAIPELWLDYVFSDEVRTRLLAPQYGDSSGVRGAAWLWGREKIT